MSATFLEPAANLASAAEALSDEQILGIEAEDAAGSAGEDRRGTTGEVSSAESVSGGEKRRSDDGNDRNALNNDADRKSEANASDGRMPEWLAKVSESLPEAAGSDAQARLAEMWHRSAELDAFDAAYFGEDASARQAFAARLHAENPGALRAMYEAVGELLDKGGATNAVDRTGSAPEDDLRRVDSPAASAANSEFNPAQYTEFERATNDAVVAELNREIGRLMTRALPEGVADGARRRMSEDTRAEVHEILRQDRQLGLQVAEAIRGGNFSTAARDHVARLIAARARGVLPAAAKRVIGEWTSSVLATHRESAARQAASQKRVDIVGGAVPQGTARKGPREIDYRNTSDEEILSW